MSDVTRILSQIEQGDPQAAEKLLPLVYDELRKLAAARLARRSRGRRCRRRPWCTRRICGWWDVDNAQQWNSRGHFFAAAAEAMRRILVESARRKAGLKRGGELQRHDLDLGIVLANDARMSCSPSSEALDRLGRDERPGRPNWSSCGSFAGLTNEQAADGARRFAPTADQIWAYAGPGCWRAWP